MATDTTVNNLIINKLTQAQYNALESPSDTELYLVPDEIDTTPTSGSTNPVTSGGVYSALNGKLDTISDLATIRSGAALGATALQEHQDISGKLDKIPKVNHGTSDTTFALTPNNQHIWGSVSSLTLTLTPPNDTSVVNEYLFIFTSPATPTTLSLPATIEWAIDLDIEPNKTYQVSIVDNLATYLTAEMVIAGGDAGTPAWATKEYVDAKLDGIESLLSEL